MAFLAVSYPKLTIEDFQWIQNYRKENDERYYNLVEPHFTFVFPVFNISSKDFAAEIKKQSNGFTSFEFECKVTTVNFDRFGNFYHEFLVPDTGYSDIVRLHDALYADGLKNELRLDIDFIPHIGIGNSDNALVVKNRVDTLNAKPFTIKGRIEAIDVIEFENDQVHTIEKILLA